MEKNTEKQEITMKTGVVDVGGGLRGIYAAGVLDYCMEHGIRFDLGIGVSAGSANLASYAAGQIGRNYKFYTEKEYAKQGKVLVVAPDDTCGVDTLKKDKASLHRLYEKGYADGQKIKDYLCEEK